MPALLRVQTLVLRAVPTTSEYAVGTVGWSAYVCKHRDDAVIADLVRAAHDEGVHAAGLIQSARRAGALRSGGLLAQARARFLVPHLA